MQASHLNSPTLLLHAIHVEINQPEWLPEFTRASRINRRQLLQIGSVSALGLSSMAERLAMAQSPGQVKPRAKACIFLFMWGGPSQLDTFDLKPNAPAEIRGQFNPIATKSPRHADLRTLYAVSRCDGQNLDHSFLMS